MCRNNIGENKHEQTFYKVLVTKNMKCNTWKFVIPMGKYHKYLQNHFK